MKKVSQGGTTSGNFVYLYDGTKLRAVNGAGQGFDYLGSLVYNRNGANSTLESAAFGAGRIIKTSTGYDVRYFLTDHLGSVRASIRDKANGQGSDVIDRSDYQLLGERWAGTGIEATTNRYQFNGKECQMVLAASGGANGNGVDGLNTLDGSHLLDYGARNYDPNIGRWFTPDPLSEKYNSMSPYLYCAANPINTIDPDGRLIIFINGWHNGGEGGRSKYWEGFDAAVKNRLKDYNAIYRDGANGGGVTNLSLSATDRKANGKEEARRDINVILGFISKRNSDGKLELKETMKIITHSMGAAYAKGYVEELIRLLKARGIDMSAIAFEADFAPYQPNQQSAVAGVRTLQYSHNDDWMAGDDRMAGAEYMDASSDPDQDHAVKSFWNQVQSLPPGDYIVKDGKIVPVK